MRNNIKSQLHNNIEVTISIIMYQYQTLLFARLFFFKLTQQKFNYLQF